MGYLRMSAPTPAAASIKVAVAVANALNYKAYHLAVAQTFTKADLDCVVYMELPIGCGKLSGKFVRLEQAVYILRQSGLLWDGLPVVKLATVPGMGQCKTYSCVFCLIGKNKVVLTLTVHVADTAVAGPRGEIDKLLLVTNAGFSTNDRGELSFLMGCEFTQDSERVSLASFRQLPMRTLHGVLA